ncbi:hypothetical protein ACNKHK_21720 [Shigella flexneri]
MLKIGRVVREQVQVGRIITFGGKLRTASTLWMFAETMEGRFVGINARAPARMKRFSGQAYGLWRR